MADAEHKIILRSQGIVSKSALDQRARLCRRRRLRPESLLLACEVGGEVEETSALAFGLSQVGKIKALLIGHVEACVARCSVGQNSPTDCFALR